MDHQSARKVLIVQPACHLLCKPICLRSPTAHLTPPGRSVDVQVDGSNGLTLSLSKNGFSLNALLISAGVNGAAESTLTGPTILNSPAPKSRDASGRRSTWMCSREML